MDENEMIDGLNAVGLNPLVIDETTDFEKLPVLNFDENQNPFLTDIKGNRFPTDENEEPPFIEDDFQIEVDEKGRPKTNAKRNKAAGHNWERDIVFQLKDLGFRVGTTRNYSRVRDSQKVDIIGTNEKEDGQFPANIQAKNEARVTNFQVHLKEMPKEEGIQNVVAFRQTSKATARFMKQGDYAIMYFDSFLYYLNEERENKLNKEYIGELERQIRLLRGEPID